MDQQVLADAVKYGFRISHTEEGWISPFLDAVRVTDHAAADWKPSAEVASIWEIVAHAIPYTESRLGDFTNEKVGDEEDWPSVTDVSAEAWSKVQARVESAVTRLQAVVEGVSAEELAAPRSGKKTPRVERLMDMVVHDAYHAGQVVKLQQVYAAMGREAVRA